MNFSPITSTDLKEVLDFWSQSPGVGLNESDTIERLNDFLLRNPGLSLIVRDEDRVIGAVLCGHDGRRGYLHHLAVATDYQGQGIGTRLIDTCLANLGQLGIWKCNIFVYADNEVGAAFWRARSWIDRVDLKVMQRVIDA